MENLWHYLRSHYWSNRAHQDDDELRASACDAWHDTCPNPARVKSVRRCGYLH